MLTALSGIVMAATTVNFVFGGQGYDAVLGNIDGDGKADPTIYEENTGSWSSRLSGNGYNPWMNYLSLGGVSNRALLADWDGDGQGDPTVYDEASGTWTTMLLTIGISFSISWGGPGYLSVAGDFNGDMSGDFAIYHEATGQWTFVLFTMTSAVEYIWDQTLGGAGWIPILADFDGDGKADPTVYEEGSGTWIFALSSGDYAKVTKTGYAGGTGWSALAGDYDGDGMADAAVYERTNGTWNILLEGSSVPTPSNVTASLGPFQDYIQVSWAASAGATSYEVYRRDTNTSSTIGDLLGTTSTTNYLDEHADSGRLYYYRVRALSADGHRSGLSASAAGYRYGTDIKVNDSHGPVTVSLGSAVTVAVQMDPGASAWNADFWVIANANGSIYYLDSSNLTTEWLPVADLSQAHPVYQGQLFYLPSVPVINSYPWLPRGAYTFYFAVDAKDGVLDLNNLWSDSVVLYVQ